MLWLLPVAAGQGDPTCWGGVFQFWNCCAVQFHGPGGDPKCWEGDLTFSRCCRLSEWKALAWPATPLQCLDELAWMLHAIDLERHSRVDVPQNLSRATVRAYSHLARRCADLLQYHLICSQLLDLDK